MGLALAASFLLHFPWDTTLAILKRASPLLIVAASALNLLSFSFKAWAWHLLLRPVAPHRWSTAQEAMFVGAAVNSVSVSVGGEAARIYFLLQHEVVPLASAVSSVVWSRVVEGIALGVFVAGMGFIIPVPAWMEGIHGVLNAGLVTILLVSWFKGWDRVVRWLPARLRNWMAPFLAIAAQGRLGWPVVLGLLNWVAEGAAYYYAMRATGAAIPIAAAYLALVAANIVGAPRFTPGNLGVLQGAVIVGFLPFGIDAPTGMAAGLVLQAVLVLPVIAVGAMPVGLRGFRELLRAASKQPLPPPAVPPPPA